MKKLSLILLCLCFGFQLRAQISNLPHLEDFENEFQGVTYCAPNASLNGTWRNVSGIDDFDWTSDLANTNSGQTGPSADHTRGDRYGHYLYVESSCDQTGYPSKRVDLHSAYYDFRNWTGVLRMDIWFHMWGNNMGNLHFDVDTTRGTGNWINNFEPAWTDNVNAWQRKSIDISAFAGLDSVRFRLRGITGNGYAGDMSVDDILVYEPSPRDVGVTDMAIGNWSCGLSNAEQITVTVQNFGTATLPAGDSIPVAYRIDNQTQVLEYLVLGGAFPPYTATSHTFSQLADLSSPQLYRLYAGTLDGADPISLNDDFERNFRNYESIDQFPYLQDFEQNDGGWVPEGTVASWERGTPNKAVIQGAASGWNAWTTNLNGKHPNGENSWVQSPCFDFSNLCRPVIRLKGWWESEFSWDGAALLYSTNQGQTWARIGNFGDPNWYTDNTIYARPGGQQHGWTGRLADTTGSGGYVEMEHRITSFAGQANVSFRIAFAADLSYNYDGFAFDDVMIYDGVFLGPDISLCQGDTATLAIGSGLGGDNVLWSTGATSSSISVTAPGSYWVQVSNNNYCTVRDTIEVIGVNNGYSVALGADTTVCGGLWLDAQFLPGAVYQWSNGDSLQRSWVETSGTYWVDVNTACGVVRSDSVSVTIQPAPLVNLGADTTVCGPYLLDAGAGSSSYTWSGGSTGQTLLAAATGTYSVTATAGNGCSVSDTLDLVVNPVPQVSLGGDTTLCAGDSLCFTAGTDPGYSYTWSTGENTASICVNQDGKYFVGVSNAFGCVGRDTANIDPEIAPIAGVIVDTSGCPVVNFIDNSSGGMVTTWAWSFGDGGTSSAQFPSYDYSQAGPGIYLVKMIVSNACGLDSLSTIVSINCPIGREEIESAAWEVYPNPSRGLVNIRAEQAGGPAMVEVRNAMGQLLLVREWPARRIGEEFQLNLLDFSSGTYLIRLLGQDSQMNARIILSR